MILADIWSLLVMLGVVCGVLAIAETLINAVGEALAPTGLRIPTDPVYATCDGCRRDGVRVQEHRTHPLLDIELFCDRCLATEVMA